MINMASGSRACAAADVDAKPRAGRPMDDRLDDVILDAAIGLLAEVGYDRMSVESVASRAGVGKTTIYRRWPGKQEVVLAALSRRRPSFEQFRDTGSLRGDLLQMVHSVVTAVSAQDMDLIAGIVSAIRRSEELNALVREQLVDCERKASADLVERAIARGELSPRARRLTVFHDLAPSAIFARLIFAVEPADDAFLSALVDDVLIPVLRHA